MERVVGVVRARREVVRRVVRKAGAIFGEMGDVLGSDDFAVEGKSELGWFLLEGQPSGS